MNTKITITLNGRVAPQQSFQLGYKYENVGYAVLLISIFTGIYSYVTTPIMMTFYYVVSIFM